MRPVLTIKDIARESMLLKSRMIIALVLVICVILVLTVRMVQLQVFDHDHFRTLSHNNRVKLEPIGPTRGLIFDRNGIILAQNTPTYSLEIVPEAVFDIDETLARLGEIVDIREADEARFRRQLEQKRRFESVPVRYRLDQHEVARFSVNRHRFPGVDVRARLSRDYPLGKLAAHLVGYVGRISEADLEVIDRVKYRGSDSIGKIGVEQSFETALHGGVGYQNVEVNAQGRVLRVLERSAPKPGSNLYLTIDASLQAAAEAALGEENGAIVAIEPATGNLLALVSIPGFDPNLFVDDIDVEAYEALLQSPDRPLFNRAIRGRYPPGSTLKPFIALAGLENRVEHAYGETWCPGWFRLKGREHKYRDWKKNGHGRVDLEIALVQSCDVYFYELAVALGIDRIHDFLAGLGFGELTGVALTGEVSGLNPSREWKRRVHNLPWFPGETVISGIGQGFFLTTPLQLASATATLATSGKRMRPRIVDLLVDPQTGEETIMPVTLLNTVEKTDPASWQKVLGAMVDVVHSARGTARRIGADAEYTIAGKTGTAQVVGVGQDEKYDAEAMEKRYRDHALFIAFAPADDPRIAVAVLVENAGSGSRAAAPVARKVLDHYLRGIRPGSGEALKLTRLD